VDGHQVATGHDAWVKCPDEGWHECELVARDEGGETTSQVGFAVTSDGSRPRWPRSLGE
jgi:hypothetical protein